ncbi:MAG: hypothetical protein JJT89_00870 [Nitriliruptoraceae bacterium]|nr:hypothetical protein [Nitriliruptoraceae bacterium]
MLVPRVQLRVFAPLDSFPPRDRERWRAYVDAGRGLTRAQLVDAEAGSTVARLVTGRTGVARGDAALVRRMGRQVLVCPLELDLRAAVALANFARAVPATVLPAFLPDERSRATLERLAASGRAPHILDAPFAVPLLWFLLFTPGDRRVRSGPAGIAPRVIHLTTVAQALDRLDRAIDVVETRIEDGEEILIELAELVTWLDVFDPGSLLELDYGAAAGTYGADELRAERTCAQLWDAVEALEQGDLAAAIGSYEVARSWWSRARARQHTS